MNFPSRTALATLTVILILGAGRSNAANERTVTIDTRSGVSVGFVLVEPDRPPVANVILFVGGSGKLKLWRRSTPLPLHKGNFLGRTRQMFAGHGFLTAVVDVPSDRRRKGLFGFRHSADHREDIEALVRWMQNKADLPVWLIGTSRGTISIAHLAARMKIDGAVFTASVTESSSRRPATVFDGRLEDVTAPALVVHNRDDECFVTPSSNVHMIRDRLKKSAAAEVMIFSGGRTEDDNLCRAMTYHGFLGIEDRVVAAIAGWIRARLLEHYPAK